MLVSELEKKPERMISAARIEKSRPSGASFKTVLKPVCDIKAYLEEKRGAEQALKSAALHPVEDQFQHHFRAKESQHQQCKAGQGQTYCSLAAPAQLVVTPQQH